MSKRKESEKIIALTQRQMLIKRINIWYGRELGDAQNPYSTQKTVALREIIDNSIDAIRKSGEKGKIKITFNEDYSVECYDSGGGIPTAIGKTSDGQPASSVFLALGVMNAGSNYTNESGSSLGTNGVGGSGSQLLSEYTKVEVYREKKKYSLDFKDGNPGIFDDKGNFEPISDLTYLKVEKDNRPTDEKKEFPSGTKILIKLNDDNFKSKYPFNADDLIERMRGVAFLVPSLTIEIINHLNKLEDGTSQKELFQFDGGVSQLLEYNTNDRIIDIISLNKESTFEEETMDVSSNKAIKTTIEKEIGVDFAFTYCNDYEYEVDSYVNTIKTRLNGFHVDAFEKAFVKVFNDKFRSIRCGLLKSDEDPIFEDFAEGLHVVISAKIAEPEFTNQIKEELGGKKALREFTKLYTDVLEEWVNQNKNLDDVRKIADKVVTASKNRIKAREAQQIKREKARLERSSSMPEKLIDCEITHSPDSELFIVEGDSALGGLKSSRDSRLQALLPLRGKAINVLKSTSKKVLANAEIQSIIKCLDAGVGVDFDLEKARYQRVIIATDADPDGANIAMLVLVIFYKLFPAMVEQGRLYKACTPLFIVKEGKETHYCYNDEEYENLLIRLRAKNAKFTVTRAKGLGETGAKVLHETGMNPETRTIQRITIGDIEEAERALEISMGNDINGRKQWIEDNPVGLEAASE